MPPAVGRAVALVLLGALLAGGAELVEAADGRGADRFAAGVILAGSVEFRFDLCGSTTRRDRDRLDLLVESGAAGRGCVILGLRLPQALAAGEEVGSGQRGLLLPQSFRQVREFVGSRRLPRFGKDNLE